MTDKAETYDRLSDLWIKFAIACRAKVESMTRIDENMRGEFWEAIAVRCSRRASVYAGLADKARASRVPNIRAVK